MENLMARPTNPTQPEALRPKNLPTGFRARAASGQTILSQGIGILPVLTHFLQRLRLTDFLRQYLPPEDRRSRVQTARVVTLLLRNLLVSREPVYGVAEWASRYVPDLFQLRPAELEYLNDDRVGRALERVCDLLGSPFLLEFVRHVVQKFDLSLDELHNDSTSISFFGDYDEASRALRTQRALRELADLKVRLAGTRTRFTRREKVAEAVEEILTRCEVRDWLTVEIETMEIETFVQTGRGRPGPETQYTRHVATRYRITWQVDPLRLERAAAGDGIFPLISNIPAWNATEILAAYKR
jgi:hypothetical protein